MCIFNACTRCTAHKLVVGGVGVFHLLPSASPNVVLPWQVKSSTVTLSPEHSRLLQSANASPPDLGPRPALRNEQLTVTVPRNQARELPIKQDIYDKWLGSHMAPEFQVAVAEHDRQYNPGGVPWSKRRVDPEPPEAPHPQPTPAAGSLATPAPVGQETEEALKEHEMVPSGSKWWHFKVSAAGQVWVVATADGTLTHGDVLFLLKGKFRTGPAAEELLANPTNPALYQLLLTPFSLMTVTIKGGDGSLSLPTGPTKLGEILLSLEKAGVVKVTIQGATAEHGADGNPVIAMTSTLVLEGAVVEKGKPTLAKLSAYVDWPGLLKSPHVVVALKAVYDVDLNKLSIERPAVHLGCSWLFKPGGIVRLW